MTALTADDARFGEASWATPAADTIVAVDGCDVPIFSYDQLELLSQPALRSRALALQQALAKREAPQPRSRSQQGLLRWMMAVQAEVLLHARAGGEEDTETGDSERLQVMATLGTPAFVIGLELTDPSFVVLPKDGENAAQTAAQAGMSTQTWRAASHGTYCAAEEKFINAHGQSGSLPRQAAPRYGEDVIGDRDHLYGGQAYAPARGKSATRVKDDVHDETGLPRGIGHGIRQVPEANRCHLAGGAIRPDVTSRDARKNSFSAPTQPRRRVALRSGDHLSGTGGIAHLASMREQFETGVCPKDMALQDDGLVRGVGMGKRKACDMDVNLRSAPGVAGDLVAGRGLEVGSASKEWELRGGRKMFGESGRMAGAVVMSEEFDSSKRIACAGKRCYDNFFRPH